MSRAASSNVKESHWHRCLKMLLRHCQDYGIDVKFGYNLEDTCDWSEAPIKITIGTRASVEKQVYSLLHELGHAQIQRDISKYFVLWVAQGLEDNSKIKRSAILLEEMLAWEHGLQLAEELYIKVDHDRYMKYATDNFMSYVKWAVTRKLKPAKKGRR